MDLKLDASGDVVIENGDLVLVDGVDAIAQDVSVRLKFFLAEWFLDTRQGVPWFQKILGQKPRLAAARYLIRRVIMTTPGIISISDFTADFTGTTRALTVTFEAQSESGPFTYDKELIL